MTIDNSAFVLSPISKYSTNCFNSHPLELNAPKWRDFTKRKYMRQKKLLNTKWTVKQEDIASEEPSFILNTTFDEGSIGYSSDKASSVDSDWFNYEHPSLEMPFGNHWKDSDSYYFNFKETSTKMSDEKTNKPTRKRLLLSPPLRNLKVKESDKNLSTSIPRESPMMKYKAQPKKSNVNKKYLEKDIQLEGLSFDLENDVLPPIDSSTSLSFLSPDEIVLKDQKNRRSDSLNDEYKDNLSTHQFSFLEKEFRDDFFLPESPIQFHHDETHRMFKRKASPRSRNSFIESPLLDTPRVFYSSSNSKTKPSKTSKSQKCKDVDENLYKDHLFMDDVRMNRTLTFNTRSDSNEKKTLKDLNGSGDKRKFQSKPSLSNQPRIPSNAICKKLQPPLPAITTKKEQKPITIPNKVKSNYAGVSKNTLNHSKSKNIKENDIKLLLQKFNAEVKHHRKKAS